MDEGRVCNKCEIYKPWSSCWCCCKTYERLDVDHCHETGLVRGLLCFKCNTAIGKLGDTASSVMNAYN